MIHIILVVRLVERLHDPVDAIVDVNVVDPKVAAAGEVQLAPGDCGVD
jgi:hypothetical protein